MRLARPHTVSFFLQNWYLFLAAAVSGLLLLWRSALRPTVALALMPLFGLVVNRPYWGFLAMPLCVVALGGLPPVAIIRAPAGTPPRS